MIRTRISVAVILTILPLFLFAQTADSPLPTDISVFVDQVVEFASATLASAPGSRASVGVAAFTVNDLPTPLGDLLAATVSTRLANTSRNLTVIDRRGSDGFARVDYLLTGRMYKTDSALLVVIQLLDPGTRQILRGMETGFGTSDWVISLLEAPTIAVPGSAVDPFEPDSMYEPYVLSVGEVVEGRSIAAGGDEDWYLIEVPGIDGQGLLTVRTTGDTDTFMTAFGPDDPELFIAENDDSGDSNASVTIVVEPFGTYWFVVAGYDESTSGAYVLVTELVPFDGDPLEPNDRREDAVSIAINGEPIETMIMPGSDVDWFVFDLSRPLDAENVVSIETTGRLDTVLELYDGDGLFLLENDDGGQDGNGRIDAFLTEAGRYYVKVRHYDGSDQGDYGISVRLTQASPDEWEPDNTRDQARIVPIDGSRQIRNFTPADESDWITFSIQATQTVEIRTTGNIDTYMTLYDDRGNVVAEDDDSGGDYNARIERVLQRGTYYVELRQVEGDSVFGGEYGLSVQAF